MSAILCSVAGHYVTYEDLIKLRHTPCRSSFLKISTARFGCATAMNGDSLPYSDSLSPVNTNLPQIPAATDKKNAGEEAYLWAQRVPKYPTVITNGLFYMA